MLEEIKIDNNPANYLDDINNLRFIFNRGKNITQDKIDHCVLQYQDLKNKFLPDKKDEIFALVDEKGKNTGFSAPRWLCHLLNLRHRSVHILLKWQSPALGDVFILQVRSWTKSDSPGRLDISVGGHVIGSSVTNPVGTAYREMEEELGISKDDLINMVLVYKGGYEHSDNSSNEWFYNTEWRDIYIGEITTDVYKKINFKDNEVVGLYLCPEQQASNLLHQKFIPIASALQYSLPKCL